MAYTIQFDVDTPESEGCAGFEAMLAEAVDGMLSIEKRRSLEIHIVGCARCAEELAMARRGSVLLSILKTKIPRPPVGSA